MGIETGKIKYEIKNEPIGTLLEKAKVMVIRDSAVSIEALAYGCRVIVPVLSDSMFKSPLKGFEDLYIRVADPEELKSSVDDGLNRSVTPEETEKFRDFISSYWCLDPSMKRWESILA